MIFTEQQKNNSTKKHKNKNKNTRKVINHHIK